VRGSTPERKPGAWEPRVVLASDTIRKARHQTRRSTGHAGRRAGTGPTDRRAGDDGCARAAAGRGPQWGPFTTVNDASKGHRTARIDHPSPSRSAVVERSREFAEFPAAEAGVGADTTQPARGTISTGMDWDRHGLGPWSGQSTKFHGCDFEIRQ